MITRAAAGLLVACGIALLARRTGGLSTSGATAAAAIGTAAIAAGWAWGALLVAFFVSSTLLSRHRASVKAERTRAVVAKRGERDAAQVLANGGVFGAAALLSLLLPWSGWMAVGAGALGAATSDTWATEVGGLAARPPRSIVSGRVLAHGTSGGVTVLGTAAAAAGAVFFGLVVWMVRWPAAAVAGALLGGIAGSTADSLLGATLQARRCCPSCGAITERTRHDCGASTRPAGGVRWLDNDWVNAVCTLVGAIVAGLWM